MSLSSWFCSDGLPYRHHLNLYTIVDQRPVDSFVQVENGAHGGLDIYPCVVTCTCTSPALTPDRRDQWLSSERHWQSWIYNYQSLHAAPFVIRTRTVKPLSHAHFPEAVIQNKPLSHLAQLCVTNNEPPLYKTNH